MERELDLPVIAVFGLGEAGGAIARDLADAGAQVRAYDPAPHPTPSGVTRYQDPTQAVTDADLILSVTSADDAPEALAQALGAIAPNALYADLSTSAPADKTALANVAAGSQLAFTGVALMATVPERGMHTPQLASGPGAQRYADLMGIVGVHVTTLGDDPGEAAARKLLRSILTKGLTALLIEALEAGRAAGLEDWLWDHLVETVTDADEELMRRLIDGTSQHALRRREELQCVVGMLEGLRVEPRMSRSTRASLDRVATDGMPQLAVLSTEMANRSDR